MIPPLPAPTPHTHTGRYLAVYFLYSPDNNMLVATDPSPPLSSAWNSCDPPKVLPHPPTQVIDIDI